MLLGTAEGIEADALGEQYLLDQFPVAVLMCEPDWGVPLGHEDEVHADPSFECYSPIT
ncbi:hypothetical protein SAZ11_46610 [Streptomyces sp. FXJ1.4098]|nr:hypothetical protein [Streptomyces sp. FXJ1.4098]